jgi:hypothetical protein
MYPIEPLGAPLQLRTYTVPELVADTSPQSFLTVQVILLASQLPALVPWIVTVDVPWPEETFRPPMDEDQV